MRATTRAQLVIYDVRDPKGGRRVHRIVRGDGHRVQLSVFRVRATEVAIERRRGALEGVMEGDGNLLILPPCPRCAQGVAARHDGRDWPAVRRPFTTTG